MRTWRNLFGEDSKVTPRTTRVEPAARKEAREGKKRTKETRETERFANQGRRGAKRQAYRHDKCGRQRQKAPGLSRFDPPSPAGRIFSARCAAAHARHSRNEGVRRVR